MTDQLSLFNTTAFKSTKIAQSRRDSPVDIIFTLQGADATCCLAVRAGLGYGVQSKSYRLCPYLGKHKNGEHVVAFCDNEYHEYNHDRHVRGIADIVAVQGKLIKYVTVRDLMTPEQCKQANIDFFGFDTVMRFAEDVEQFADNVIIIPKYDCIGSIPDKYMLGFSVPSSHGGTPLLPKTFAGRRVHLLGGSWKAQIKVWSDLPAEVVSLDNNHCNNIARYGQFYLPDGTPRQINKHLKLDKLSNPRYVALAISFGNMIARARELQGLV